MNISSSNAMIYAKEFDGKMRYSTAIVKKNNDNKYDRAYLEAKFQKGVQLENKTKIKINKGFMSFYKSKEGKDVFYLMIQEFEVLGNFNEEQKQEIYKVENITTEQLDLPMDLPF